MIKFHAKVYLQTTYLICTCVNQTYFNIIVNSLPHSCWCRSCSITALIELLMCSACMSWRCDNFTTLFQVIIVCWITFSNSQWAQELSVNTGNCVDSFMFTFLHMLQAIRLVLSSSILKQYVIDININCIGIICDC